MENKEIEIKGYVSEQELSNDLKEKLKPLDDLSAEKIKVKDITNVFTNDNVEDALFECMNTAKKAFQEADNGKTKIANALGAPLSASDTYDTMNDKISNIKNQLKTILQSNNIITNTNDSLHDLIIKFNNIKIYKKDEKIDHKKFKVNFNNNILNLDWSKEFKQNKIRYENLRTFIVSNDCKYMVVRESGTIKIYDMSLNEPKSINSRNPNYHQTTSGRHYEYYESLFCFDDYHNYYSTMTIDSTCYIYKYNINNSLIYESYALSGDLIVDVATNIAYTFEIVNNQNKYSNHKELNKLDEIGKKILIYKTTNEDYYVKSIYNNDIYTFSNGTLYKNNVSTGLNFTNEYYFDIYFNKEYNDGVYYIYDKKNTISKYKNHKKLASKTVYNFIITDDAIYDFHDKYISKYTTDFELVWSKKYDLKYLKYVKNGIFFGVISETEVDTTIKRTYDIDKIIKSIVLN